ncbi:hypothetical protein N7492_001895 [Penicillium capsulatum]|uniref:Uncharacterized protein n=1 Tax=Penicillium capsulatum TaxID=69766 RepID=A0A9W9IUI5_9EURO|nr:hypothetical protein N7492_001895 [Penicillium capsulatum]
MGLDLAHVLITRGGWKVHILGRHEEHLAQASKDLPQATVHRADVRDYRDLAKAFQAAFREDDRLDFVFANAGVIERTNFYANHAESEDDSPPPDLDATTLEVDLKGVTYTAYLALHYFRLSPHHGRGAHMVINSSCGGLYPALYAPLYSAAKYGMIGFMRSIAQHFHVEGIQVNAICTGIVRTNLVDSDSWNSFPAHRLLEGGEGEDRGIIGGNGTRIPTSQLYGCTVEISDSQFYFRQQIEYCDQDMKEVMGATALVNQVGAILNH